MQTSNGARHLTSGLLVCVCALPVVQCKQTRLDNVSQFGYSENRSHQNMGFGGNPLSFHAGREPPGRFLMADFLVNAIVERICICKSVIFERTTSCPMMSNVAQSFLTIYDALQPFLGKSDVFIGYLPGLLVSVSIWSDFDWKSLKSSRKRYLNPI